MLAAPSGFLSRIPREDGERWASSGTPRGIGGSQRRARCGGTSTTAGGLRRSCDRWRRAHERISGDAMGMKAARLPKRRVRVVESGESWAQLEEILVGGIREYLQAEEAKRMEGKRSG